MCVFVSFKKENYTCQNISREMFSQRPPNHACTKYSNIYYYELPSSSSFFSSYVYAHTLHIRHWVKKFGFNLNNVENDRERTLEKLKDTRVEMI